MNRNACGKIWAFPNRTAALRAMPGIPVTGTGKVPVRTYYCRNCKAWHVTSKPRRKPKRRRLTVMAKRRSQEDTDGDYRSIAAMADRLGLKGEERSRYVHKHMTTLGHRPQTRYVPGGDEKSDDDGGSDDFW